MSLVGRLAPSPNGLLHLGHARSFVLAWLSIRSRSGRLVLRMDDLDPSRCKPEYEEGVLRDLEWLGLDWDGPVTRQSNRGPAYAAALAPLLQADLVYACTCTRREIALSAPHASDAPQTYPGTCRGRYPTLAAAQSSGRSAQLRLRVPAAPITIQDRIHGPYTEDLSKTSGDFPLFTHEGLASYQFATVIDDQAAAVTEVLRGDDLLPSTTRQALLQDALAYPRPIWIHVSLVTESNGHRLAKRSQDRPLAALRAAGLDPRTLLSWIARTAGLPAPEPLTLPELLPLYTPPTPGQPAPCLDPTALATLNLSPPS
jgi:glutamyl-tRNA synthetase